MTLRSLTQLPSGDPYAPLLGELQRIKFTPVAGAAAGVKMVVPGMHVEDTIAAVLVSTAGVFTDDTDNCTSQGSHASGTLTAASVADADACVVNGVTYTFKDTPTGATHVRRVAGNNNTNAARLAAAINAYEVRRVSGVPRAAQVNAVAVNAVVTITAIADGTAGNSVTLTGTAVRLAASAGGVLAAGAASGGFKSTTDLSTLSLLVVWFDKNP